MPEIPRNLRDIHITFDPALQELHAAFPNGGQDGLLPAHFLQATYHHIGGKIISAKVGTHKAWGLLMPGRNNAWTLRCFLRDVDSDKRTAVSEKVITQLSHSGYPDVALYDFENRSKEEFSGEHIQTLSDEIKLARPNLLQAKQAQYLQKEVWGSADTALYPADLYHPAAGLATQLVASHNEHTIAFLLGFYARGNGKHDNNWIESQIMAVHPDFRGKKIAEALKFLQRQQALEQGIEWIHWTFDPLQYKNASLNCNSLGGTVEEHFTDHYAFNNTLNKVPASRFGLSWNLNSPRVQRHAEGYRASYDFEKLSKDSGTEIITPVRDDEIFNVSSWEPQADTILVGIPSDWNRLQATQIELAKVWRQTSDEVFVKLLSGGKPAYAFTGAVTNDEDYFLIAQKSSPKLHM